MQTRHPLFSAFGWIVFVAALSTALAGMPLAPALPLRLQILMAVVTAVAIGSNVLFATRTSSLQLVLLVGTSAPALALLYLSSFAYMLAPGAMPWLHSATAMTVLVTLFGLFMIVLTFVWANVLEDIRGISGAEPAPEFGDDVLEIHPRSPESAQRSGSKAVRSQPTAARARPTSPPKVTNSPGDPPPQVLADGAPTAHHVRSMLRPRDRSPLARALLFMIVVVLPILVTTIIAWHHPPRESSTIAGSTYLAADAARSMPVELPKRSPSAVAAGRHLGSTTGAR